MIQELLDNALTIFETYRGNGKLLVVFLVALLFLLFLRSETEFNPVSLIVAPLGGISMAASKLLGMIKGKLRMAFALFVCGFVIMLSGQRIYSADHLAKSENAMHIPQDYKDVMDYMLKNNENPTVLAMPDYSMYHTAYSSRFNMLFELRTGDDVRYYPENVRDAFSQLSVQVPDMEIVSEAALEYGCDYIVLASRHYWPILPLERYDYELETTIGDWEIYSQKEDVSK